MAIRKKNLMFQAYLDIKNSSRVQFFARSRRVRLHQYEKFLWPTYSTQGGEEPLITSCLVLNLAQQPIQDRYATRDSYVIRLKFFWSSLSRFRSEKWNKRVKRVVKLARFYTCEYQTLLSYEKIVTQAYQKKEFRVVQVGVESKTFYWKPVGAIVDKSPWDTVVMRRIICVLQLKIEKAFFLYRVKHARYITLYHAIEKTANQNTGKPLYIQRYYIQPSHHAPRVCRIDCVGHCIFYVML